jgi:signal transduction histidine kinase/ActR/RegA family two-component response regulator
LITSPLRDADRTTRCTDLQHLAQDKEGQRLATACATPVYIDGQYVGAFGSSLNLQGFFMSAVRNPLPGATSVVSTGRGEMIASPAFSAGRPASLVAVRAYEQKVDLARLLGSIRRQGGDDGVVISPNGADIVAYSKLTGPDWYLLMSYPRTAVMWSALRSASWVLLIGLLAACVQTVLLVALSRKVVVDPLQRLAASCGGDGGRGRLNEVGELEGRRDEIGVLARALRCEREKVDDVLNFLEHRVRERTAELERANAEKSRFLANMSHELRTPLNGVIAVAQTLAARQNSPRDRDLADLIVSSGRLLEQVLSDILDSAKIESGQMTLCEQSFSIDALVGRIGELHRAAAEAKGLRFTWAVADDAMGAYYGDAVRLSQILSNLLSNAVKFTQAGEVSLTVTAEAGRMKFTVADSGIGFDEAVKTRLFRRFEQADSSINRRFGGAGLGLSISQALVELMGGAIAVRSAPGLGSVFEVDLPLSRAEPAPAEADDDDDGFSLQGCRILLAEDHPTNQKVVELILEPFGALLEIVEDGALALERLAERSYDVVLMDMQMPVLDGLNATRRLREREAAHFSPRTPVIMLTANAMDDHIRDSFSAGVDRHLAKPVNAMLLLNTIAELLIESGLAAETGPKALDDQAPRVA